MRINTVLTIIAIAMAVLIGYLAFSIAEGEKNDIVCGIASTTCFTAVLVPIVGLQYHSNKLGINIRDYVVPIPICFSHQPFLLRSHLA